MYGFITLGRASTACTKKFSTVFIIAPNNPVQSNLIFAKSKEYLINRVLNQLILISWNHMNTEIKFRDQLVLTSKHKKILYREAESSKNILEFSILSTCNRIEFYFIAL